jgi:mitochondrial import inner membrane translocase subunit TIM17
LILLFFPRRREPCPHRIFDDIGGAFAMGVVGGGAVNLLKGFYNSPKGHVIAGGCEAVRREAPKIGGSFAVWGGLFSAFDCTLVALRRKEDHWNPIISGALTGGTLQLRYGLSSAGRSAAFGGFLLAVIEGISIMLTRVTAPPPPVPQPVDLHTGPAANMPTPPVTVNESASTEGLMHASSDDNIQKRSGFWSEKLGGGGKERDKQHRQFVDPETK